MAAAVMMAASNAIPGRADGGPVTGGKPYIVGERGPELFDHRSSGTIVTNEDTREAVDRYGEGSSGNAVQRLDISYNVQEIAGERYVTEQEFRAGMMLQPGVERKAVSPRR